MRRLAAVPAVLALAALAPGEVSADEDELSVHLETGPALTWVEDARDAGAMGTMPGGRFGFRVTYGLSDLVAAEVILGGIVGGDVAFPNQPLETGQRATLHQREQAVRATAGVTARFGVEYIPTFTAHLGYQLRRLPEGFFADDRGLSIGATPARRLHDLVVLFGAGLDYRIDAHWICGTSVQLVQVVAPATNRFTAVELPLHVSYYFYP